ncbi:MAG: hypothetical protein BGN96_11015 [Bacteroidales bacterium 45-6]|nr:MAG: hypothetical protein BGN96_11015 [Bacteroidales bacterium 45-6]
MSKNLIKGAILGALFLAAIGAKSQNATTTMVEDSTNRYKVQTNKFFDNWFISAGIGGQVYLGKFDAQESLSKRITPTFNGYLGKWFTPGLGLRFGLDASTANGLSASSSNFYVTDPKSTVKGADGATYYKQKIKYYHINAAALFNLTNIFCGYKESRFYNFIPYVGFGWLTSRKVDSREDELSVTGGLLNTFRLGKALNLTLDLKGTQINGRFDHEGSYYDKQAANQIVSATIGLVYKFNKRNWDRCSSKTVTINNEDELNALRQKLDEANRNNDALQQQLANAGKPKIIEKIIEKPSVGAAAASPMLVIFPMNKTTLSKDARVNVGFYAQVIKTGDPKAVYVITGYADKGTGSAQRNAELSKARAQAVYDALVDEFGISPSQLTTEASGGVDNLFYNDPAMSRAAITKIK